MTLWFYCSLQRSRMNHCWTPGSFCFLSCLFSVVLGIPALRCSSSTHTPSFLLTSAGQLLLYGSTTGGFKSQVLVLTSPWEYKQLCLLQLFSLNLLFLFFFFFLTSQFIYENWFFGFVLIWQMGVYSPTIPLPCRAPLLLLFCMCWMFLPGWKYIGTESLVCAAVAVPADAAPGHCPSDSSAEWFLSQPSILGYLILEKFTWNITELRPAVNVLCLRLQKSPTCPLITPYITWPVPLISKKKTKNTPVSFLGIVVWLHNFTIAPQELRLDPELDGKRGSSVR